MENRLISTEELRAYEQPLPQGLEVIAFRIVNIGPNTLANAEYMGSKICDIEKAQSSFFIISESLEEIRKTMHNFVDRFCDIKEGK